MRKPADNEVNMYMLNHCGSRLVLFFVAVFEPRMLSLFQTLFARSSVDPGKKLEQLAFHKQ